MAKTAVGLFSTVALAEKIADELETSGFSRDEIRIVTEPLDMPMPSVLSTPGTAFLEDLSRELLDIGATEKEAEVYVQEVRGGASLLLATGSDDNVEAAVAIMNRANAEDVEKLQGMEPAIPSELERNVISTRAESVMTGRTRQSGSGARIFTW